MPHDTVAFNLPNPDATDTLARWLAPQLGAGDTLLLHGPLGAGKSHFARALITARLAVFGLSEDIPSPTFTLVQTYDPGDVEIWHADLYRLSDLVEIDELGLESAFDTAICLIEWPDRLGTLRPANALDLIFDMLADPQARRVTLRAKAARWQPVLAAASSEQNQGVR